VAVVDAMSDSEGTAAQLELFSHLVATLRALPADDPGRLRAEQVALSFARNGRLARRRMRAAAQADADSLVDAATATGARERREDAPLERRDGEAVGTFARARQCYVCKEPYRQAHAFYHMLCPECAGQNAERRAARADLSGRRALLTGGRVKIGFQLALMLLRDGAQLTVTSRFPHDAARRFRGAPVRLGYQTPFSVADRFRDRSQRPHPAGGPQRAHRADQAAGITWIEAAALGPEHRRDQSRTVRIPPLLHVYVDRHRLDPAQAEGDAEHDVALDRPADQPEDEGVDLRGIRFQHPQEDRPGYAPVDQQVLTAARCCGKPLPLG
jgi:hypothetical protein